MIQDLKNKDFKKIEKKFNKIAPFFLFTVIAIIVVVVVILSSLFAKKEIEQYSIRNKTVYTFIGGEKLEFNGKITLNHSNDVTNLEVENGKYQLGSEPLYIEGEDSVIFPSAMSVVMPLQKMAQYKVGYFTLLKFDDKQPQPILSGSNISNIPIANAFIYDGGNIYFFLEDTKLTFDGKTVMVSAMSFVDCSYKGDLEVVDYTKGESTVYENVNGTVLADHGDYRINLSFDSVEIDGVSALLIKNVDSLGNIK